MKSVKSVFKVIGDILLTVTITLLVVVTFVSLFSRFGSNGRMMIGRFGFGVVATGSMEPELPVGTFVLVERKSPDTLKVGDTIMFYSDDPTVPKGIPVSHKIQNVTIDSNGHRSFITKGVANPTQDEFPVRSQNVLGKVVWSSALIGGIIRVAQNPIVYPILIAILLIDLVFNVMNVVTESRKLKEQSKNTTDQTAELDDNKGSE